MKTLSEKIIEQLQRKHDGFLGTKGELSRQSIKDGLRWAIGTIETLTNVDNCEKEYEAEQLRIANISKSLLTCKCGNKVNDLNNGLCYPCWNKKYEASK